jgi:hypothetical protein
MSVETILIIVLIVFLLGGSGLYWGAGAVDQACSRTAIADLESGTWHASSSSATQSR